MLLIGIRVLSILSVALYLVPAGAHLFELTNKMAMSPPDYMIAQRLYRGWALFGVVIFVAMLLALLHALLRSRIVRILSLASFLCLAATQAIFWLFTYPMNVASSNWTVMPDQFAAARRQWEYSHAASAVLTFVALLALALAVAIDAIPSQTRASQRSS
jgi:hypothetical protein